MKLFILGLVLTFTVFGIFFLGAKYSCTDGYMTKLKCVKPVEMAACSDIADNRRILYIVPEDLGVNFNFSSNVSNN